MPRARSTEEQKPFYNVVTDVRLVPRPGRLLDETSIKEGVDSLAGGTRWNRLVLIGDIEFHHDAEPVPFAAFTVGYRGRGADVGTLRSGVQKRFPQYDSTVRRIKRRQAAEIQNFIGTNE